MKPKNLKDCDYLVKAVIIGDSGVGKTNILLRYCDNSYDPCYSTTIGLDWKSKMLQVQEYRIKLQIWDTAGQEKFKNLSPTFYKAALAIILTYSVDSSQSFKNVVNWIKKINEYAGSEVSVFLTANKMDLRQERAVEAQEGERLAKSYGMKFYEVSAKEGTNIQQMFQAIGRQCYNKIKNNENSPKDNQSTKLVLQPKSKKTPSCTSRLCGC